MQQEGWHYELEDKNEPLTYKGVVFNEMKGVYSSPDSLHGRTCQQVRLFARTGTVSHVLVLEIASAEQAYILRYS